jgi:hypothetical protein
MYGSNYMFRRHRSGPWSSWQLVHTIIQITIIVQTQIIKQIKLFGMKRMVWITDEHKANQMNNKLGADESRENGHPLIQAFSAPEGNATDLRMATGTFSNIWGAITELPNISMAAVAVKSRQNEMACCDGFQLIRMGRNGAVDLLGSIGAGRIDSQRQQRRGRSQGHTLIV